MDFDAPCGSNIQPSGLLDCEAIAKYKIKDLIEYCKKNGIKNYSKKNKNELIQHINYNIDLNKQKNIETLNSEINTLSINNITYIDLFCGIGGFHQALNKLNCKCVLACDIDKKCREVYYKNYQIEPFDDIKKINENNILHFDILCAGFPCQPFSNGGNKKSFNDDRGLLFDEIIRIASYNKPKFMFLENVKHILKVSNGEVIEYIKNKIKSIGYHLQLINMSPHNYGIPQQRERIFFVCVRNDIYNTNINDIQIYSKNLKLNINDIISNNLSEYENIKYKCEDDILNVLNIWDELIKQFDVDEVISPTILINDYFKNYTREEFNKLVSWRKDYMNKNKRLIEKYIHIIRPWYDKYKDILTKREIYGKLEWQTGKIKENDSIFNYFIQIRQSGIRVKKTNYFPTLVAISQIPIYGKYKRYITPRECARLQSFPDEFILDDNDKVTYKQMGNSVNVYNTFTIINSTLKHYNLSYNTL